jgi:hypothetical protein
MSDDTPQDGTPRPRTLALATGVAALLASAILVVAVLPAEFGIDPLGTGRALGLLALGNAEASPLESHDGVHATDSAEFVLEPFQSLEYKYHLTEDATLVYSWDASSALVFDMHADPEGLEGEEFVESFEQATGTRRSGTYHAPFTGIHGWFWENRSFEVVTLRIEAAGFFDASVIFRDGGIFDRVPEPAFN